MDPLVIIMVVVVGGLLAWVVFLGLYHPRSGADVLDWRPTRSPEVEAQNEIDDLDQMLQATNERRRRRGEAELTEEMLEARVREDRREQQARAEEYREGVDLDVEQMLARVNEGRRRRGEPELTADEYRARIESESA